MNQHNKKRNNNKEAMIQKQSVITMKKMQDFNKDIKKKKMKKV